MTLQLARFCKSCGEQLHLPVPLRGPASIPFRMVGIRPSRMNPNTCTICELMFKRIMKARKITIDVSILFADLRGYTTLSQSRSDDAILSLLDVFYDECVRHLGIRRVSQQDDRRFRDGDLQFSAPAHGSRRTGCARRARDPAPLRRAS